jgi:hypothetical protein
MGRQRNIRRSRETTPTRDLRCQDDGVVGRKPKESEKPAPAKCGSKKPLACNRWLLQVSLIMPKDASSRPSASCHNLCNIEHPLCRIHGATNRHHAPELARAHFLNRRLISSAWTPSLAITSRMVGSLRSSSLALDPNRAAFSTRGKRASNSEEKDRQHRREWHTTRCSG